MGIDHHLNYTSALPVAHNITEKKARVMPAVGIYRPPAARRLDAQQTPPASIVAEKPRSKQRRPDIQVYVPRPKRTSFGGSLSGSQESSPAISSDAKSTRRHSSSPAPVALADVSKTTQKSLDDHRESSLCQAPSASTLDEHDCTNAVSCLSSVDLSENLLISLQHSLVPAIEEVTRVLPENKQLLEIPSNQSDDLMPSLMEESPLENCRTEILIDQDRKFCHQNVDGVSDNVLLGQDADIVPISMNSASESTHAYIEESVLKTVYDEALPLQETAELQDVKSESAYIVTDEEECVEVIPVESTTSDKNTIEKVCLVEILAKERLEKCEEEEAVCRNREDQNRKNRSIHRGNISFISDILVISDTESTQDLPLSDETNSKEHLDLETHTNIKLKEGEETKSEPQSNYVRLNPDECTWDMMFDENGDCLDPLLMEELTSKVGEVTIKTPQSDYKQFVTREALPRDEYSHVIEIYNFPAEFKTQDLITVFSAYRSRGFEIKWVDDTHALGVFSSSVVAEEVLETSHPFLKTRPLHEATPESRSKARRSTEFLQPYRARPETCPALARRMVTGALGVRLSTAKQEREAEKALLKVARDKKKLEARQKDEAWEGTLGGSPHTTD